MLLLIILFILIFEGAGYYGHRRWDIVEVLGLDSAPPFSAGCSCWTSGKARSSISAGRTEES
jgi:hypothetical protein